MQQEEVKKNFFKKYKLYKNEASTNLLTRSLLWMGLGLSVIILIAWLSSTQDVFLNFVIKISYQNWFIAWLFQILIIFALFICVKNKNVPIIWSIFLYIIFSFYEGIFITSILVFSNSINIVKDLLLYMLIPSFIFALMGILGYFNLIDFTKLIPFSFFCMIAILILSFILIFTSNWFVEKLYLIISMIIFMIWIGFDIQLILKSQSNNQYYDKKMANRISFIFGIKLFVDFINIFYVIIRLFK